MENAPIQLTYIEEAREREKRLFPRKMLSASALPYTVELPGAGRLFTIEPSDEAPLLKPEKGISVALNGQTLTESAGLAPGDRIQAGGYLLDFHYMHKPRPLSFASRALSLGAKLTVALFIICEIAVMLGLSSLFSASNLFEGSVDRQRLSYDILRIQKKLDAIKTTDAMETAMLALLREDISRRVNYMGDFGDMLSPRQRKNMSRDLRRLDMLLDTIAQEGQILPVEKIKVEEAVKEIIERHRIYFVNQSEL